MRKTKSASFKCCSVPVGCFRRGTAQVKRAKALQSIGILFEGGAGVKVRVLSGQKKYFAIGT
jgi:hypothetical protein